ncbi:MAG: peptidylprolyl isomerase [Flavobacteriales bacterium]|jgi:peptidyl-prolyl cis-trans isomerase SurA
MRIVLLYIAFLIPNFFMAQGNEELVDKVIAVVGDEIVLYSDLKNGLMELSQGTGKYTRDQECQSFEDLVYQKLLLNQARLDSVEVTDGEVQSQVERRMEYFINMFGSVEQFEAYYGKTVAQMKEQYFDMIKEQLLVQKEQETITKSVRTTPADVLNMFKSLPVDSLPLIGEQLQYSQIKFDPEVRESVVQQTIHMLDSIRNDIVNGKTSMTIQAARWSEDPGSRFKGGCYPLQRKGSFVPEYEAAVFNTNEGEYSPVFKSDYGYHFVKVIEKRGEFYETCHILVKPKVVEVDLDRARMKADSVYRALAADSLSFEAGAMRYSTDKETKNQGGRVINPATGGTKVDIAGVSPEVSLVLRELKPGEISQPVLITDDGGEKAYVIYRLDNRLAAHRANMEMDYEIFQIRAEAEMRKAEVDKWVRKTINKTYVKLDPSYADCDYQFEWNKSPKAK